MPHRVARRQRLSADWQAGIVLGTSSLGKKGLVQHPTQQLDRQLVLVLGADMTLSAVHTSS